MTTYYPQRIKTAAATFKYSATAFVDFIFRGDLITLKLQAPEIGAQFEGPVDYGKAPKGIIFFDDQSELLSGDAQYSVNYFDELGVDFQGHYITFKVDFFKDKALQPFASFIVRVEVGELPPDNPLIPPSNQRGSGTWSSFHVATCQTNAHGIKIFEFFIIILEADAITKWAGFFAKGTPFDTPGILIFFDRRDLVNDPRTVADYSKDRIVFRRQGTNDVVALFLPSDPLTVDTGTNSVTLWVEPEAESESSSQANVKYSSQAKVNYSSQSKLVPLSQSQAVLLPQGKTGPYRSQSKQDQGTYFAQALKEANAK